MERIRIRRSRRIRKARKIRTQPLCGECPSWVPDLSFEEEDCESFLLYDSRLDVVRRIFLGKKCVCDIEKKGEKHGSKLYFHYCNGKWLMDFHGYLLVFGSI